MNRVFEISELSNWSVFAFIKEHVIREVHITTYLYSDRTVARQDTSYIDHIEADTTYYHVPEFIHKRESYNIVTSDLEYIETHVEELSFNTFNQVKDLLAFFKQHPVVFVENNDSIPNCEWASLGIYKVFEKKINEITRSYLRQLKKYGMEARTGWLQKDIL